MPAVTMRWFPPEGREQDKLQNHSCGHQEQALVFSEICWENHLEMVLERRGAQDSWLIFKDHLLQAQECSIPMDTRNQAKEACMDEQDGPDKTDKKRKHTSAGSRVRSPRNNIETPFEHTGMG